MTIITTPRAERIRQPNFSAAGVFRGLKAAWPFVVSNGAAGLVMGLAYQTLGLGVDSATLFSLLVYSATAQAATLGMWASPPPVLALVTVCLTTNARYLVMGAHLRQLFGQLPRRKMLPTLFILADASWLMTTADAERHGPDAGYLLGASLPMAVGWVGGTALAYVLPVKPAGPIAVAAALLPLCFIVTVLPVQWRGLKTLWPWCLSAGVALLAAQFLTPSWAMLMGGTAGTLWGVLWGQDV